MSQRGQHIKVGGKERQTAWPSKHRRTRLWAEDFLAFVFFSLEKASAEQLTDPTIRFPV